MGTKYGEFIRMTDVQTICQEMIFPIMNSVKARETDAMMLKNQVAILNNEMKQARIDVRQAMLMKNLVQDTARATKKNEEKQQNMQVEVDHMADMVDVKILKLQ